MKRIKAAALLGMCMAVFTACRGKADVNSVSELEQGIQAVEEGMELFTPETRIQDVIDDPAFEGFGRLVFPVDLGLEGTLTLKDISRHRGHTGGFPNGVRLWKRPYQRLVQRGYA